MAPMRNGNNGNSNGSNGNGRSNNGSSTPRSRSSLREKKLSRIRQHWHTQVHRMGPREFHRRCASHIRAIRYLRLRNEEIAMLNCVARLRNLLIVSSSSNNNNNNEEGQGRRQQLRQSGRSSSGKVDIAVVVVKGGAGSSKGRKPSPKE